jgi:hypothetical protein
MISLNTVLEVSNYARLRKQGTDAGSFQKVLVEGH